MTTQEQIQREATAYEKLQRTIRIADVLQVVILLIAVAVSYTKMGARVDSVSQQAAANAAMTAQLHESLDRLRASTAATPEAERRLSLIEQRITMLEQDRQEFKRDIRDHLDRLEDKIDSIIERR